MTKEDFLKLSINQKAEFTWDHGKFIESRAIYNEYDIRLYNCPYFFVEIWVCPHEHQIKKITIPADTILTDIYAEYVDIESLIS